MTKIMILIADGDQPKQTGVFWSTGKNLSFSSPGYQSAFQFL